MAGRGGRAPVQGRPPKQGPPPDYVDPELAEDKLPMPYRLIDKIVNALIDSAVETSERATACPTLRVYQDPPGMRGLMPAYSVRTAVTTQPAFCPSSNEYFFGRSDGCFERHNAPLRMQTMVSQRVDSAPEGSAPEQLVALSPAAVTSCVAAATRNAVRVVCFPPPPPRERKSTSRHSSAAGSPRGSVSQRASASGVPPSGEASTERSEEERQTTACAIPPGSSLLPGGSEIVSIALSPCARFLTLGVATPASAGARAKALLFRMPPLPVHFREHAEGEEPPPVPEPTLLMTLSPPQPARVAVPNLVYICGSGESPQAHSLVVTWLGQPAATFVALADTSPQQQLLIDRGAEETEMARVRVAEDTATATPAPATGKERKKSTAGVPRSDSGPRRPQLAAPIGVCTSERTLFFPSAVTAATLSPTGELMGFGCSEGLLRVHDARSLAVVLSMSAQGPEKVPGRRPLLCHTVCFWRRKYVCAAWAVDGKPANSGVFCVYDLATGEPARCGDHVEVRRSSGEWRQATVMQGGDPLRVRCQGAEDEEVSAPAADVRRPPLVSTLRYMPAIRGLHCTQQLPFVVLVLHGMTPRVFDLSTRRIVCRVDLPESWTAIGCGVDQGWPLVVDARVFTGALLTVVGAVAASCAGSRLVTESTEPAPAAAKPPPKGKAPAKGAPAAPAVETESVPARAEEVIAAAQEKRLLSLLHATNLLQCGSIQTPEESMLIGVDNWHHGGVAREADMRCAGFGLRDLVHAAYPALGRAVDENACQIPDICALLLSSTFSQRFDPAVLMKSTAQVVGALRPVHVGAIRHGSIASATGKSRTGRFRDKAVNGAATTSSQRTPDLSSAVGTKKLGGTKVEFAETTTSTKESASKGLTYVDQDELMAQEGLLPLPGPRERCQAFLNRMCAEREHRRQRTSRFLEEMRMALR
eukprot:TRINITY_DN24240_c0_g1_i1.p1 TRINITY_DN24240_c0_g1~~TRINITY_DN24240_c0_g1_i1.p1  ORF type:complete len:947 (+),score=187.59 TRINITY_DN24240_c0_g1_i1:55-2841(+)